MAFDIRSLFRKKKKEPEVDDFEELGDKEEPEAITGSGATKPKPPEGTTIQPKVLIIAGIALCALVTFVIFSGSRGPKEKTAQEKAEENFKKTQSAANTNSTPDDIGKMPLSYGTLKDQSNLQNNKEKNQQQQQQPTGYAQRYTSSQPPVQIQRIPAQAPVSMPYGMMIPQNTMSKADKEVEEARKSSIRFAGLEFNSLAAAAAKPTAATAPVNAFASQPPPAAATASEDQDSKRAFIERSRQSSSFYIKSSLQAPVSEYEVKAGTIIPSVLITGINSDLPGQIIGQVRENVYDSVTGQHILIPHGSKLIGQYDSQVEYGQSRVLVVWNRLILPSGESLDLEGMGGADMAGYSGFRDRKNDHIPRILNGAILGSILTAGARIATGDNNEAASYRELAGQGIAENIAQAASQITDKNLNVQPTLEIRPGYLFNVFVNKDIILKPYQY